MFEELMLNVLAFIIDNLQEKDISKKYKLMWFEIVYLRFPHEIKEINQKKKSSFI
jgi:hypothetical protein